jgi:hypothetical protein
MKGFHWVAWVPALLGLWWFRDRLRITPGSWVLFLVCLSVALLLLSVAIFLGYVSDRHAILLLLCGSYWAVAAVLLVSHWCSAVALPRLSLHAGAGLCTALVMLGLVGSVLPKTLAPLHSNRSGFRDAGFWLAEHLEPGDSVFDPYCWTSYYSGYIFRQVHAPATTKAGAHTEFVIVERSSNSHPHLPQHDEVQRRIAGGKVVFQWEGRHGKDRAEILIYAVAH